MNVFTGIGRIGRDAEVRYTPNQIAVATWPVGIDVGYGDNKQTLWLECSIFGKRAEGGLIDHLTKGKQIGVTGEIGVREWDKNDGSKGHKVTLRVNDVKLLDGGQSTQAGNTRSAPTTARGYQGAKSGNAAPPPTGGGHSADPGFGEDDIPFGPVDWRGA